MLDLFAKPCLVRGVKFHERIAHWRGVRGLSQADVARKCKVTPAAVGQWETGGYPDVTRLPKIAAVLGTTVEVLIEGDKHYQSILEALGGAA